MIRADGAGTSAKLADYLRSRGSVRLESVRVGDTTSPCPVQFWPNFPGAVAVQRSDGVANYVSNPSVGVGAIGYVEAGYAYEHGFTPAFIKNRSGNYAAPSSENVATRAEARDAQQPTSPRTCSPVYNAPEASAYPLASYSYLITPDQPGFDPAKGAVLGKWIIYIACAGQKEAAPLGLLAASAQPGEGRLPGGAAHPRRAHAAAADAAACPNPTVTGERATAAARRAAAAARRGAAPATPHRPPDHGGGSTHHHSIHEDHRQEDHDQHPGQTTPTATLRPGRRRSRSRRSRPPRKAASYKAAVKDVTAPRRRPAPRTRTLRGCARGRPAVPRCVAAGPQRRCRPFARPEADA